MAIEKISIEIKSNVKDIDDQLKDIDNQIKKLKNSRAEISINAEKLTNAKTEINKVNIELKKLAAEKALLKVDSSEPETAKKKMADITEQMDKLRARKAVLQVTTEQLKGADTELKRVDKQLNSLNNRKATLQLDKADVESTSQEVTGLGEKLARLGNTTTNINISSNVKELGNQLDSIGDKMLAPFNPLSNKLGQYVGLGAVFKAVDSGINMVTGSVDDAINRFDTLNNSTRSFMNMGVDENTVTREIENIKDAVQGLPTALDSAISNVQLLTGSTNDMGKSVKIFEAMNNGILGFGGNAQMVDNAVVQLSQSFSNGRIDAQTWNSMINSGLGPSLNALAKNMDLTTGQLKESLSDGTVSVEEFQNALIELNEKGGGGMASLKDIVKDATSGVKTGMANMKTAVTRGVANIISSTDNILKDAGWGGIGGVLAKVGETFESTLTKISQSIVNNQDTIVGFFNTARKLISNFSFGGFAKGFLDGLIDFKDGVLSVWNVLSPIFKPLINGLVWGVEKLGGGDFSTGLGKIAAGLLSAGISFKVVGKSLKLISGPLKLLEKFKIPKLFGKKGTSTLATTFEGFKGNMFDGLTSFAKNAGNLALIFGALKVIEQAAESLRQIDEKIPNDFKGLASKIASMALAISSMGALAFVASKLPTKEMITGLVMVAALSVEIMLVSEALKQLNEKVPSDIGSVAKKMASIGIAIGGMAALVGVVGGLSLVGWPVAIAGLATVSLLALEIMLVSESIRQLNEKVPSDFDGLENKLKTITKVLDLIIESNFAKFGALFDSIIAGFTTASFVKVVDNLVLISEKLSDLNELSDKIDPTKTKKNVKNMIDTIELLRTEGGVFASIGSWAKGKVDISIFENTKVLLNTAVAMLDDINELNVGFKKFEKLNFNKDAVLITIGAIQDVVNEMVSSKGIFNSLRDLAQVELDNNILKKSQETVTFLTNLNKDLKEIEKLDFTKDAVLITVDAVQEVVEAMISDKGLFDSLLNLAKIDLDQGVLEKSQKTVELLSQLNKDLKEIEKLNFTKDAVLITVKSIQEVIDVLTGDKSLFYSLSELAKMNTEAATTEKALETLSNLTVLNNRIAELGILGFNKEAVLITIQAIQDVVTAMTSDKGLFSSLIDLVQINVEQGILEKSQETIGLISTLNDSLKTIEIMGFNKEAVLVVINAIQEVIETLSKGDQSLFYSLNELAKLKIEASGIEKASQAVSTLSELNGKIASLEIMGFSKEAVLITIRAIKEVLDETTLGEGLLSSITNFVSNYFETGHIENAKASIQGISDLNAAIKEIEIMRFNKGNVLLTIEAVEDVIKKLSDFNAGKNGFDDFTPMIDNFSALMEKVKSLESDFTVTGRSYANSLVGGFREVSVPDKIETIIDNLITKLKDKTTSFKTIGKNWGNALKDSFNSAVRGFTDAVTNQISSLNRHTSSFTNMGTNYGKALTDGFGNSIANLSNSIDRQVNAMQVSLNNLRAPDLNSTLRTNGRAVTLSGGGEVPQYLSDGGLAGVFKKKGTDTVPAMLTPGEFVQRKAAVSTYGTEFMHRVNNLDLSGALKSLTGGYGMKQSAISNTTNVTNHYNNTNRTDNANFVQHFHSDAGNFNGFSKIKNQLRKRR